MKAQNSSPLSLGLSPGVGFQPVAGRGPHWATAGLAASLALNFLLVGLLLAGGVNPDDPLGSLAPLLDLGFGKSASEGARKLGPENTTPQGDGALAAASVAAAAADVIDDVNEAGIVDKAFLQRRLAVAERAYQRNLERRSQLTGTPEMQAWPLEGAVLDTFRSLKGEPSSVNFREYMLYPNYPCIEEERVGAWGDGGKWMCLQSLHKPLKDIVVYSIGSCGDPGFEQDVWRLLKVETHTFDPFMTPGEEARVTQFPFIHLHRYGLSIGGAKTVRDNGKNMEAEAKGIHEIMAELGHSFVDVFKIDCEGCELDLVKDLAATTTRSKPILGQILMEIHNAEDLSNESVLLKRLDQLGYRTFHMETNFNEPSRVFEMAFIHESLCLPSMATKAVESTTADASAPVGA